MKKCNNCEKNIADYYMTCPYCDTKTGVEFSDLVVMLQGGDVNALEEIMRNTENQLVFLARSYTKDENDAKDVVQNAYIKAYSNIDSCIPERFLGWIRTIVTREALTFMDKASERYDVHFTDLEHINSEGDLQSFEIEDESVEANPHMKFEQDEKERMLFEILDSLPDKQRVVILKSYYEDMKIKDIAEELSINENTVKTLIRRAKESIKEAVENLERRDGIKLYNYTPFTFFLWLLKGVSETKTAVMVLSIPVSAVTAAATAGTTTATAASAALSAVTSGIMSSATAKVAVGAVVALLTVGGTSAAVNYFNKSEESVINDHVHNYIASSRIEASCETDGSNTYVCEVCNDTFTVIVEKLKNCEIEANADEDIADEERIDHSISGHNSWEDIVEVEADCDKEGIIIHKCKICDFEYKETVEKLTGSSCNIVQIGHDELTDNGLPSHNCPGASSIYVAEKVEPTCLNSGHTIWMCPVCGKGYYESFKPLSGPACTVELEQHVHTFEYDTYDEYRDRHEVHHITRCTTCSYYVDDVEYVEDDHEHNYVFSHSYEKYQATYNYYFCSICGAMKEEIIGTPVRDPEPEWTS